MKLIGVQIEVLSRFFTAITIEEHLMSVIHASFVPLHATPLSIIPSCEIVDTSHPSGILELIKIT